MVIPTRNDIDADTLRAQLNYDPATGKFRRCRWPDKETGHIDSQGRVVISVLGKNYLAHRLAWLHVHGEWPPLLIDHINCNRSDNRIINLRPATPRENSQNSKRRYARLSRAQALFSGIRTCS